MLKALPGFPSTDSQSPGPGDDLYPGDEDRAKGILHLYTCQPLTGRAANGSLGHEMG